MKDARLNPVARANAVPQQAIRVLKLGDTGYGMLGLGLEGAIVDGKFQVLLIGSFARVSDLMPINAVVKMPLATCAQLDLADLVQKIAAGLDGPKEEDAKPAEDPATETLAAREA